MAVQKKSATKGKAKAKTSRAKSAKKAAPATKRARK